MPDIISTVIVPKSTKVPSGAIALPESDDELYCLVCQPFSFA